MSTLNRDGCEVDSWPGGDGWDQADSSKKGSLRRKPYLSTTIELARARPRGLVPDYPEPKTIEAHLGHVYRKLDVDNRTQLAR